MINISEIFYSIQGESISCGLPFIFIRFAGCNLRCKYCDAKYSYKTSTILSIDQIILEIQKYNPVKNILITGGEPLLQKDLYPLIEKLNSMNYSIHIETNGSINLNKIPQYVVKIVDVKCPDSGEGKSFNHENLKYINLTKDQLKFVISSYSDYLWAKEFIQNYKLFGKHILFSAAWGFYSYLELAENILKDKLNIRFQPQIHKFIWHPEKKGV